MECPLFWKAVKNQNCPIHELTLAAVPNTRNRQAENDMQKKEVASGELTTKPMKAATKERDTWESRSSLGINYEKAVAEAINKVKKTWRQKRSNEG